MSSRAVRLAGWVLAVDSIALAVAVTLSPSGEASARAFMGWCGIG